MSPRSTTALLLFTTLLLAHCDRGRRTNAPADAGAPGASDPAEARVLSGEIAQALAGIFRQAGDAAQVDGATVRADGHTVTARATVAEASDQGDHTVAALEVWLDLDGVPQSAFHTVAIGIDANRTEAAQHAVRSWTVQYGMPTADALASLEHAGAVTSGDAGASGGHRAARAVGSYLAFVGPMGLRGDAEGWDGAALQSELLRRIGATAPGEVLPTPRGEHEAQRFHSAIVTAHVRNAQVGQANCRVDAVENERLCAIVRELPWPTGPGEMIVRQYVLFAPHTAP